MKLFRLINETKSIFLIQAYKKMIVEAKLHESKDQKISLAIALILSDFPIE